ncbi:tetratricopeptide repeat protein [Variovorax sp. WS11]|uniref:tetratricopeptide repeat protein n=1 Tax=Variovorax sp. WS11 TaxID=1105204 RepID=UPI0011B2278E|nr:hypothetical protein [Variovorax sp. WS11]NDZ12399.1 hypothetical protein [Variovorax sp. WS11]
MMMRSFTDAKWNLSIVTTLQASGCEGLEIVGPALNSASAIAIALSEISVQINKLFPQAEYWLIAGHEIPQPKTKIANHKKFWKSVGINLAATSTETAEWCVPSVEGPRYFGLAKKSLIKDDDVILLLDKFETTWIVVLDGARAAQELVSSINSGWDGFCCSKNLLEFAIRNEAVLIRNFGIGDAQEGGVIAIASKLMCRQFLESAAPKHPKSSTTAGPASGRRIMTSTSKRTLAPAIAVSALCRRALINMGVSLIRTNDLAGASEIFERLNTEQADEPLVLANLAVARIRSGRREEAEKLHQRLAAIAFASW